MGILPQPPSSVLPPESGTTATPALAKVVTPVAGCVAGEYVIVATPKLPALRFEKTESAVTFG